MYKNKKLLPQRAQSRTRCASSVLSVSSVVNPSRLPPSAFRLRRTGMSLIEVLISMFVLLFGLMGVAAIFPVGNYYVVEGEKFDLASGIAQNAFEELRARGMLKPEFWMYANVPPFPGETGGTPLIQRPPSPGDPSVTVPLGTFKQLSPTGPGSAFVLDPLGTAADVPAAKKLRFPYQANNLPVASSNPWSGTGVGVNLRVPDGAGGTYIPTEWPVQRVTIPVPGGTTAFPVAMTAEVAETIFRLRDDLAVEQPKKNDVPSIQRWDVDATNNLLRRQYKGDYSWLATIVPTTGKGLLALQPANADYGEISYDVSVVVFRKRDDTPSVESERLIEAELLQGGELVIYSTNGTTARDEVDAALEDIRPGNWISLMGVNQTTGDFVMKWYRLLSLDGKDETGDINVPSFGTGPNAIGRRAMLIGPDWPEDSMENLRAGIFPGVISVVTKPLRMEASSLWSLD